MYIDNLHGLYQELYKVVSLLISDENFFWKLLLGLLILFLFFMKRQIKSVVWGRIVYYTLLTTTIVILFVVLFNKISSTKSLHPVLQAIILVTTALLTFLAFWVQYKFNEKQSNDIFIDRFENNFYRNLELLLQLEKSCDIPCVGVGKQAFHFMFYEYKAIMSQILISDKVEWITEGMNRFVGMDTDEFKNYCKNNKSYMKEFWEKVNQISFNIFISGVSTSAKSRLYETCGVSQKQLNDINDYLIARQHTKLSPLYLDDYDCSRIRLYDGHRLRLVSFFRNVCMLVQYVMRKTPVFGGSSTLDSPSFEKGEHGYNQYLLHFLSLLSEHEISLLFIMFRYSTEEHKQFINPYQNEIKPFFTNMLPQFIMASNMYPNDDEHSEFLNIPRINELRKKRVTVECIQSVDNPFVYSSLPPIQILPQ